MINFSDYDAHKKFGRFDVTIDCEEGCSRADVWLKDECVNLAYVEDGVYSGQPEEDDILEAVSRLGYGDKMVAWAYRNGW